MTLQASARRAKHPTYRHTIYWAEVHENGRLLYGMGPYRDKRECLAKAELEAARIEKRPAHTLIQTMGRPMSKTNDHGLSHPLIDYGPAEKRKDQRVLVERKWAMPLKPAAPQKPCDVGIFSDDRDQLDLVEMARKP